MVIKYQVHSGDNASEKMINKELTFRISVFLQNDLQVPVLSETQTCTTDSTGIALLWLGNGEEKTGELTSLENQSDDMLLFIRITETGKSPEEWIETCILEQKDGEYYMVPVSCDKNEQNLFSIQQVPGANNLTEIATTAGFDLLLKNGGNNSENSLVQVVSTNEGWNGISSFIVPDEPGIENLFQQVQNQMIILYNLQGMYYPAGQVNTLSDWDCQLGYITKFNQPADITFTGQAIQNKTINLSSGWNLIPMLSDCPVDIASLFRNKNVKIIKEVANFRLFWPELNIKSLSEFLPGKAYFVFMNSEAEITFPSCGIQPWQCGDLAIDERDGKLYQTIQIGRQCWMKENLNYGNRINGIEQQINNAVPEKYCYNDDEANCDVYGGLYQWDEMMQYSNTPGVQGLCPDGWHLPTNAEWCILEQEVDPTITCYSTGWRGNDGGGKLKETGTSHWTSPNTGATNSSGFTGLPGGLRFIEGLFYNYQDYSYWWSSSEDSYTNAWSRYMIYNFSGTLRYSDHKECGYSVRCVRDCLPQPTQSNAGPDQFNVPGNSTMLQGNTAVNGTGTWYIISGTGGNIIDPSDPTAQFTGLEGNAYTLQWVISTNCDDSHDKVQISFEGSGCGSSFVDTRNNKAYNTVQIGTQCWMQENLNYGTRINGIEQQINNAVSEKYCYDDDEANCEIYGGLYQWHEMMQYSTTPGIQGICPAGWHLPTDEEWCTLTLYVDNTVNCNAWDWNGTDVGIKLKSTTGWITSSGTDEVGFTALPGGLREYYVAFNAIGANAYFWTSTESFYRHMIHNYNTIHRYSVNENQGFSVRCIRDCLPPTQSDAGPDQLNIQGASVTLQGNTPVNGTGQWSIISGTGGNIAEPANPVSIFTGVAGNTYTLRWTITTSCGSSEDDVVIIFTPFTCGNSFCDTRDNHVYNSVQIGLQCWMKENLNIGTMIIGATNQTDNSIIEKYCYNNIEDSCTNLGGFYQWKELMQYSTTEGAQGLCPGGWHLPTDAEWCALTQFMDASVTCDIVGSSGTDISGKIRSTYGWYNGQNGNDSFGFTALGVGYRLMPGSFIDYSINAEWWTSTQDQTDVAWSRYVDYYYPQIQRVSNISTLGMSARCVKDCGSPATQSNAGEHQFNINGTSATLQGNTPVSGTGLWSITEGSGGSIANPSSPASSFSGLEGNSYTLRWTISTECSTSSSEVVVSFASSDCGLPFTDSRNNKDYNTIKIGDQCWMKENLDIGTMIDGLNPQTDNSVIEKYCPDNNTSNCDVYGGLYQWGEAMQYASSPATKGLCPDGFHLPVYDDWVALYEFLGGYTIAGGKMKSKGTIEDGTGLWYAPNTSATNKSGFTALPGNLRFPDGSFNIPGLDAYITSSTEYDGSSSWNANLFSAEGAAYVSNIIKEYGLSIRCLKDTCSQPTQSDAGPDQLNINGYTTILQANTPVVGTGQWSIVNGGWGIVTDPANPNSSFNGISVNTYTLRWTISNACGTSTDDVIINFNCYPQPTADAGQDQTIGCEYEVVDLAATATNFSLINWSTTNGTGYIVNNNSLNAVYIPGPDDCMIGELYFFVEVQGVSTCNNWVWDEMMVAFVANPTANAGPDQLNIIGTSTTLAGNTPASGSGLWSIVSGPGGSIANPSNPTSSFSGLHGNSYTLRWTITTTYGSSQDDVVIGFCPILTIANAGPDQINHLGTTTTLQANTPTAGFGIWSIISETGYCIIDDWMSPSSTFIGEVGGAYTLRWTINTDCASSWDDVTISFMTCGMYFIDSRDQQEYLTVKIGTQCWMAENLNIGEPGNQTNNGVIEKSCYNDNAVNCDIYGGLYRWDEMMDYNATPGVKGICPTGWHLPTDAEWTTLSTYLGGESVAGGKMKETGFNHWLSPNTGATNESGFTALPGGARFLDGTFNNLGGVNFLWSSSEYSTPNAWFSALVFTSAGVGMVNNSKSLELSVRCVWDCSQSTASAGLNATICEDGSYTFNDAVATNYNSIFWSTFGDGTFNNNAILCPTYTPGPSDIIAGDVIVTLTVSTGPPCNLSEYDQMQLTIQRLPTVNAGPDQSVCENLNVQLSATATNYTNFIWYTIDGSGSFNNENILNAVYYPGSLDYLLGQVTLFLIASPISPCLIVARDTLTVQLFPNPTVNAGPDQLNIPGTTTTLQGNAPPAGGYGVWSITSGQGGNIAQPTNPASSFSGLSGNVYLLQWKVYSANGCSQIDQVQIGFLCSPQPTTANAGPDQLNLTFNNPSLQGNTPAAGSGQWSIISGAGGTIANPSSPTSTFTGVAATTYVLQWTISTVCSLSSDVVTISFASGWLCGTNMTDSRDETVYPTIHIGTQCWMQRNLAYLPSVSPASSGSTTSPRYYVYGYDGSNVTFAKTSTNYSNYGVLYNWPAATNACPTGWHLPTDAEWCTITTFIDASVNCSATTFSGTNAGGKMKENGTTHWTSPNTGATNSSGFTALGGGARNTDGTFILIKSTGEWWSSTAADIFNAWGRGLIFNRADVGRSNSDKSYGTAVRCIKD